MSRNDMEENGKRSVKKQILIIFFERLESVKKDSILNESICI